MKKLHYEKNCVCYNLFVDIYVLNIVIQTLKKKGDVKEMDSKATPKTLMPLARA